MNQTHSFICETFANQNRQIDTHEARIVNKLYYLAVLHGASGHRCTGTPQNATPSMLSGLRTSFSVSSSRIIIYAMKIYTSKASCSLQF